MMPLGDLSVPSRDLKDEFCEIVEVSCRDRQGYWSALNGALMPGASMASCAGTGRRI